MLGGSNWGKRRRKSNNDIEKETSKKNKKVIALQRPALCSAGVAVERLHSFQFRLPDVAGNSNLNRRRSSSYLKTEMLPTSQEDHPTSKPGIKKLLPR